MKHSNKTAIFIAALSVVAILAGTVWSRPYNERPRRAQSIEGGGPLPIPSPITVDQVTHNLGNLATTVDNWGYVGGYGYANLPSGEWPRGSGHNYLAEIKYWMGGVTPSGDTLVANSDDDFEALPSLISGASETRILMSSDTTRYYGYDPSDTVGLGAGSPAHGWRIWNGDSAAWVYNRVYSAIDHQYYAGGPASLQESHYRFGDQALGNSLMGLEMTHTVLGWNYCYNDDFLFVVLEITNNSAVDYTNFAFGLYIDIDVGENKVPGQNGNLGDMVSSDSSENLAWIYDADNFDAYWRQTGILGTKYLETPDGIGMTALRTGDWALLPDEDAGRFEMINSTEFDGSLPPTDQYYVQCTRGINLEAGKTIRVVYALIAGKNEADFRANAALAQELYNNHFVGPQPPVTPTVHARAGDRKAYVYWNDTAEVSIDPMTGLSDFAGYKLYRSEDFGLTWGSVDDNNENNCLTVDYYPVTAYAAASPGDPIGHSYIDTNLTNGVEYWYCVSAYDLGVSGVVDPLQSGFSVAGGAPNVVSITPRTDPAGAYTAAGTVAHTTTGSSLPSDGNVLPIVFDQSAITGDEYQVVFDEQPDQTYWSLINTTTGDTVLANQSRYAGEPELYNIGEGVRVVVRNGDYAPRDAAQTSFASPGDTTLNLGAFFGPSIAALYDNDSYTFGDGKFRATYEVRYTGDTTYAFSIWEALNWESDPHPQYRPLAAVPFEVWNVTENRRVNLMVTKNEAAMDGTWGPQNSLIIVDLPYDTTADVTSLAFPYLCGWWFRFDLATFNPSVGDVFTIDGAPLNGPTDVFAFRTDGVSGASATAQLRKIKVVPDPYFARYSSRVETENGETVLQFVNLPDKCTIRIYTLTGDLVNTIEKNDFGGTAEWNLLSSDQRQISSGIYIYHVDSPYGERLGRFAVIK